MRCCGAGMRNSLKKPEVGILHYSAPPVVGGVEAVIGEHARLFARAGYPVTVIAGRGEQAGLPQETRFVYLPELDTQHPMTLEIATQLNDGRSPPGFSLAQARIRESLRPVQEKLDVLIVHNVFTKHFNIPLTAALFDLLNDGTIRRCISWVHDITWTSPNSRRFVYEGHPWDLLRTHHPAITQVVISEQRQEMLAGLLDRPPELITIVQNGIDPALWYGWSETVAEIVDRFDLLNAAPLLLMPVRVTQAKNVEFAAEVLAEMIGMGCQPKLVVTGPPDPHSEGGIDYYRGLLDLRSNMGLEGALYFAYEAGDSGSPQLLTQEEVASLMRMSDMVFMPSHREGFGIPVLEAGLMGIPVTASTAVPAAVETGRCCLTLFDPDESARTVAERMLEALNTNQVYAYQRQVRQDFTWEQIFREKIEPLVEG